MTRFNVANRPEPQAPPIIKVAAAQPEIRVEAPKLPAPVDNGRELKAIADAVRAAGGADLGEVVAAIEKNTAALEDVRKGTDKLLAAVESVAAALMASKTVTRDRNGLITEVQVNGADN